MNAIEKMMASIKDWVEFYLDNSTLPEQTKDKIRRLMNSMCGDIKCE